MTNILLDQYRRQLNQLRQQCSQVFRLPEVSFFLFGMGLRRKFVYRAGVLKDARTGETIGAWDVVSEVIIPPLYRVELFTRNGQKIVLLEDEAGVWLIDDTGKHPLNVGHLKLPDFAGHPYDLVLRVLFQEIMFNIVDGQLGIPNLFVYKKPWYRDGAMMAMVLERTGHLGLIQEWILGLREPFDRNNAGETEADNLGQLLYLISLASDQSHPLVSTILELLAQFETEGAIQGRSDFALHPVYQTKWTKYGLQRLGLEDRYHIPATADSYSSLVWWAFKDQHVEHERFSSVDYPYLEWAERHFYHDRPGPMSQLDYPLSWEVNASQAQYEGMGIISLELSDTRVSIPHTWHAAEMFLYLENLH